MKTTLNYRSLSPELQKPVARNNSEIVIFFQIIKETIPELIRPGRLTPVKFDYLDNATLNEICQFYFKQNWVDKTEIKQLQSSFVTEKACEAMCLDILLIGSRMKLKRHRQVHTESIFFSNINYLRII